MQVVALKKEKRQAAAGELRAGAALCGALRVRTGAGPCGWLHPSFAASATGIVQSYIAFIHIMRLLMHMQDFKTLF